MAMEIGFPGGVAVEARYEGFTIRTDQPVESGGAGSAPSPFSLFLASIGTCAGFYVLRFCQTRSIDTHDLGMTMDVERDAAGKRVANIRIAIHLPEGFPEKYRQAVVRAADSCTVKRHLAEPPAIEVVAV